MSSSLAFVSAPKGQPTKILKMGKMKDSSLLKWTQNNKNNMLSGSKDRKKSKEDKNKNWLHSPERLTSGHIAYLVKVSLFLSMSNVRLKLSLKI